MLIFSFMLRKLYSLVSGATCADNPDSPQHHEVLLPGFLYGMIIKERFEEALNGVKAQITQDMRQKKDKPFTDCKPLQCNPRAHFQQNTLLQS
jgi:DNA-directed RNA polymerase I subunit RPA2